MRRICLLLILLSIALSSRAQASQSEVQENDRKIPESYLKDTSKPILVMFTASWCGPCALLKTKTFQHENVKPLLQQVNLLMMDIDTTEGKKYQTAFELEKKGIPYLILMDKEQRLIAEFNGYTKDPAPFVEFLNKALKPQNR